ELEQGGGAIGLGDRDESLGRGTVCALRVALRALEAQQLDRLLDVAARLDERILRVDHAGAQALPERLDVGEAHISHVWTSFEFGRWVASSPITRRPRSRSCRPSPRARRPWRA